MSSLGGNRQTSQLRMLSSEQAKLCLGSCRGAEPLVPQPTARSSCREGSCTAPPWPPGEVQVAPRPSRVPRGQCTEPSTPAESKRPLEDSVLPVLKEAFDWCQAIWVLPDTPHGSSMTCPALLSPDTPLLNPVPDVLPLTKPYPSTSRKGTVQAQAWERPPQRRR